MSIVHDVELVAMVGDRDDHRPASAWGLVVDPGDAAGRVDSLALVRERIAAGDRIPLHRHTIDELILVRDGGGRFTLGGQTRSIAAGAVVFIPAGTPHGLANSSGEPLGIDAVFPSVRIAIEYLERNPAPGTEGERPQPPVVYDLRTGQFQPLG